MFIKLGIEYIDLWQLTTPKKKVHIRIPMTIHDNHEAIYSTKE